ncbi:MAG: hypothetical protein AAF085_00570 [Planctomycetota bacterium]
MPSEQAEDLGPMTIDIDLDRLVFDNQRNNFQDPVWRLQASTGKRILFLPFTVDNVHRINKLSRFPITVRTGRFIGFVIPKPELDNRGDDGQDLNRIIRAESAELQELLFAQFEQDVLQETEANQSPDQDASEPTPETAPRLAREIIFNPDGTVQWSMDRSFHTGELQQAGEQNPYAYKIDAAQLREAQPPKPERLTRNEGEGSREFALRKREQQLEDREKQNEYRELRNSLRELPETFREVAPVVLYAAIEIPDSDDLSLQGSPPLPWTLEAEKKEMLTKLSSGANGLIDERGVDIADDIINLIQGHPLDARAVAIATIRGGLAGQVEADDSGYKVLSKLLESKDVPTRRIALYGVATTNPPTLASAKLIGVAGEAALGEERKMLSFASLGKLFSTQASDPENAKVLIDRVNQTIADAEGPAAPRVIEQVLDALDPNQSNQGFGRPQPAGETTATMIELLDLSGVTPEEYAGVAEAIVPRAPDSPVAAGWLDQKLLGSTNRELVNKTLSVLYEAKVVPPPTEQPIEQEGTPEPVVVEPGTTLLSGTIPMTRADHALIGLFESSDDVQQAAAWAVLGRFHIALPPAERGDSPNITDEPTADPTVALFDSILEKSRAREKVPASVVSFMVNQQDAKLTKMADEQLVALLADKDVQQKTTLAAIDAYIASPERFQQSMQSLESSEKQELMQAVYAAQDQEPPLITGLIADQGTTLTWMTTYVKENEQLPTPGAWAAMAAERGEDDLLRSAASEDVVLCTAAAAALVVAAGGDEQQEIAFAQTVALMEARTNETVREEWSTQRNKIYAASFKRARGAYQLIAAIFPANEGTDRPEPEGADAEEPVPDNVIDLGVVELRSEGIDLSLSVETVALSPVSGQLGIRINEASSLQSFNKPELSRIQQDDLRQPIDLLPADGGAWEGQMRLRDGRTLRVTLDPAN